MVGECGFTVIEVVFAALFLIIFITGVSHLLVSGMTQQHFDTRDQLAMIAVNNAWERTLTRARDNFGPSSSGGASTFGCGPTNPGPYSFTSTGNAHAYPPGAPDLFQKCPNCTYNIQMVCNASNSMWNGSVEVVDGNGGMVVAAIPIHLYQPGE